MFDDFCVPGKANFILDGQWGSAGKGAAAAHLTRRLCEQGRMYDIVTANNGAQSGHTSVHDGVTRVAYHIPTAPLIAAQYGKKPAIYLNAGSIIDPVVLWREIEELKVDQSRLFIHPNAAIITDPCKLAEMNKDSAQTKIASTRKGVGEALARKVLRYGVVAGNYTPFAGFIHRFDLNGLMSNGSSVLVEVPQGISLSVNGSFFPFTTSRDCTVMSAASDAGIHPHYYGDAMLVMRTYPIRVGSIVEDGKTLGTSGGCYSDQEEISWNKLGVKPEITTVTKRVRRVFTFSARQLRESMALTRPRYVQLTFCDYPGPMGMVQYITDTIEIEAEQLGMFKPTILYQYGPSTDDVETEIR